jgi:hypothetical protein
MKLGTMKAQLPWALEPADLLVLPAGQLRLERARCPGAVGRPPWWPTRSTRWWPPVVRDARPGDHVVCMSNGSFGGMHDKLLAALARMNPPPTHLLYLHGFRSSPRIVQGTCACRPGWQQHRPDVHWWCPQLPPSPRCPWS